jgi:hypothetical protein
MHGSRGNAVGCIILYAGLQRSAQDSFSSWRRKGEDSQEAIVAVIVAEKWTIFAFAIIQSSMCASVHAVTRVGPRDHTRIMSELCSTNTCQLSVQHQ